ncbi:CsgG/HfaB family protein [Deferribacter abyssi]|uniref:CsgG/HfaB family protein n=1 Tax=Deferribacter abyssi TaxID=213806 RepID=UPI003C224843
MKKFFVLSGVVIIILTLISCGPPKLDPMSLSVIPADTEQVKVPDVCRVQYESRKLRVAVVDFANNTTFGKMTGVNTSIKGQGTTTHTSAGVAGIVVAPGAAGIGYAEASKTKYKYSKNINTFMRQIAPNIGNYAQSAVEDILVNMGGVDVFTRANMKKVMQEQGFQINVADQNTLVKFGKIAGVSYIITGTVDNIKAYYVPPKKSENSDTGNALANLALTLTKTVVKAATEGWNVNVEMTVQVIDVSTGRIIASKKVKGRELAGTQPNFNPELIITAAKKAMGEAAEDIKPELSDLFAVKGYIIQLRGNKEVALVNLGKVNGIQPGQELEAYEFLEIKDPFKGTVSCSKARIPVKMIVSDQVDENQCWVKIEGDERNKQRLKIGTLVKRAKLHGQGVMEKLF